MSILATTVCYPHRATPTQGIFVQRRLTAIHALTPVRVVAPVPWFPLIRPMAFDAHVDRSAEPPVVWPKMFYLPGLLKRLDARFYAAALRRVMPGILASGPVSLMDAHFVWPDGVGAWIVARELGVPFVCTIRGKIVSQIVDPRRRGAIAEMLREADALIAVSQAMADLADEVAGKPVGAHVIPNGVEASIFCRSKADASESPNADARIRLNWSSKARYAVCVGHLQTLKRFDLLVEAWPEVRRRAGDVRLVLVGGDANEPAFAKRLRQSVDAVNAASDCSEASVVSILGRQSPEAVAELLNAADLFVHASRSEGWCNAIAEALACGCPVVATDVGGNREIVANESLGLLTPPNDRAAFIDAVCDALARGWNRNQIAEHGSQRSWRQVAAECVDVFEEALGRNT